MKRLLLIGLDQPEIEAIKEQVTAPVIAHEMIPRVKVQDGTLYVEKPNWLNTFVPVSHKAKARHPNGHFRVASAEQLAFPTDFFDLVFSVDVIHHVHDRPTYFQRAYQLLKPGGKICTVTDSEQIIRHRQPLSLYFPETIEFELQRYPRMADLHSMMLDAGLSDVQDTTVEFSYSLTNIDRYRAKAFSCLHLIPAAAFERGLQRMEEDLRAGAIRGTSRYVLVWGRK